MLQNQRLGIIDDHTIGDAVEIVERSLNSFQPCLLVLMPECPHVQPARITQFCHKEVDLDFLTADLDQLFPKVDLYLLPRQCFKTHGRFRFSAQLITICLHRPFYRTKRYFHVFLRRQFLPYYIRIALVLQELRLQPFFHAAEHSLARRRLAIFDNTSIADVFSHCVTALRAFAR